MADHIITTEPPGWVSEAIFYQVFPERFADGDPTNNPPGTLPWGERPTRENFFGGDLQGIIDHLDHIRDLGATALYLTPIFAAETNHRYDCTDYLTIDPHLGNLDTFRRLVAAAHNHGLRIVLDAVFNHCGKGHWAFQDVVRRGAQSPYINWFYIEDLPVVVDPQRFNYATCGGAYYLPQWNVHHPDVRAHLFQVTRQWTAEGIDGWRLDVPYFMNKNFWRRFRKLVKGIDDDLYIVAEVWDDPTEWLRGDIADGAMNYPLRDLILGFVADRTLTPTQFAAGLTSLNQAIPRHAQPSMLNLLGSHDTERLITRCHGDHATVTQALALLVTSIGAPMIYYGDEIGIPGDNDPDCRACMPWDPRSWDTDILDTTRTLLALRHRLPALVHGCDTIVHADDDLLVRQRGSGPDMVIVAVNRSSQNRDLPIGLVPTSFRDHLTNARGSGTASVSPHGVAILADR